MPTPVVPAPTRAPLEEGETAKPTPPQPTEYSFSPTRSPLPEGETHSPTLSPIPTVAVDPTRSPLETGETYRPTQSPIPTTPEPSDRTFSPTVRPTDRPTTQDPTRSPLESGETYRPTQSPTSGSPTPSPTDYPTPITQDIIDPNCDIDLILAIDSYSAFFRQDNIGAAGRNEDFETQQEFLAEVTNIIYQTNRNDRVAHIAFERSYSINIPLNNEYDKPSLLEQIRGTDPLQDEYEPIDVDVVIERSLDQFDEFPSSANKGILLMISNPDYTFSGCDEPEVNDLADRVDQLNVTIVIILVDEAANQYDAEDEDNDNVDNLQCLLERGQSNSELFEFEDFEDLEDYDNVREVANLLPVCPCRPDIIFMTDSDNEFFRLSENEGKFACQQAFLANITNRVFERASEVDFDPRIAYLRFDNSYDINIPLDNNFTQNAIYQQINNMNTQNANFEVINVTEVLTRAFNEYIDRTPPEEQDEVVFFLTITQPDFYLPEEDCRRFASLVAQYDVDLITILFEEPVISRYNNDPNILNCLYAEVQDTVDLGNNVFQFYDFCSEETQGAVNIFNFGDRICTLDVDSNLPTSMPTPVSRTPTRSPLANGETARPTPPQPTEYTFSPTSRPSSEPTDTSNDPTRSPLANGETFRPTQSPVTDSPTPAPTDETSSPTRSPLANGETHRPTMSPTTGNPTVNPTRSPLPNNETYSPTISPTTPEPTRRTSNPTTPDPTSKTRSPATPEPSRSPLEAGETYRPTTTPTRSPLETGETFRPTESPTTPEPTGRTFSPTVRPTDRPTTQDPTRSPLETGETYRPTQSPTTGNPTPSPTDYPTAELQNIFDKNCDIDLILAIDSYSAFFRQDNIGAAGRNDDFATQQEFLAQLTNYIFQENRNDRLAHLAYERSYSINIPLNNEFEKSSLLEQIRNTDPLQDEYEPIDVDIVLERSLDQFDDFPSSNNKGILLMISNPDYTFGGCDEPADNDIADRIDALNVTVVIILVDEAANQYDADNEDNDGVDDLQCLLESGEANSKLFEFEQFEELVNDTNVRKVANLLPYCPPPKCECKDLATLSLINSGNCPRNYTIVDGLGFVLFDGTLEVGDEIELENFVNISSGDLIRSYLGNSITVITDTVDYVIDASCYPNCTQIEEEEEEYDMKRRLTGGKKGPRTTAPPNPVICFPTQNRLYAGQEFAELGLTITNGTYIDGEYLCDKCDCDGQINQIVLQNVDLAPNEYRIFDADGVQVYENVLDTCETVTLKDVSATNKLNVVTNNDYNNQETILLKCCEEPDQICTYGILELEFEYIGDSPKVCDFDGFECDFNEKQFCKVDFSHYRRRLHYDNEVIITCGGKKGEKEYVLDLTCETPVCRGMEIKMLDLRITNGLDEQYLSIPNSCYPWYYEHNDDRRRLTYKDPKIDKECEDPIFEDKIYTESMLQVTCPTTSKYGTQICPGLNDFEDLCPCVSGFFTDTLTFLHYGVTQRITVRNERNTVLFNDIVKFNSEFSFNRNTLSQFISIEYELGDDTVCISTLCRVEDDNGKKRDAMYEICEDRDVLSSSRRLLTGGGNMYPTEEANEICCDNDLYIGKQFNYNKLTLIDATINDEPLCQQYAICN